MKLWFVIPALNERDNLPRVAQRISNACEQRSLPFHVIVVDDGSTDDTGVVALQSFGEHRCTVVRHETNLGPGAAVRDGFRHALSVAADDDAIVTLEADGTSDLAILPALLQPIREGTRDVMLASPYASGGAVKGTTPLRWGLSLLANMLSRWLLGIRGISTYSSFYRVHSLPIVRRLFARYGDKTIQERGFAYALEMVVKFARIDARIAEVPMTLDITERIGKSRMRIGRTIRAYLRLFYRHGLVERIARIGSNTPLLIIMLSLLLYGCFAVRAQTSLDPFVSIDEPWTFVTDEAWDVIETVNTTNDPGYVTPTNAVYADIGTGFTPLRAWLTPLELNLFGSNVFAFRIPSLILGFILLVALFRLCYRHDTKSACILALLAGTCVFPMLYFGYGRHYAMYALIALPALAMFCRPSLTMRDGLLFGALAGLLAGSMVAALPLAVGLLAAFAIFALPLAGQGSRTPFRVLAGCGVAFAAMAGLWWLLWYQHHIDEIRNVFAYRNDFGTSSHDMLSGLWFTLGHLPTYSRLPILMGLALCGALTCWFSRASFGDKTGLLRLARACSLCALVAYLGIVMGIKPRYLILLWPALPLLAFVGIRSLLQWSTHAKVVQAALIVCLLWGASGLMPDATPATKGWLAGVAVALIALMVIVKSLARWHGQAFGATLVCITLGAGCAYNVAEYARLETDNRNEWASLPSIVSQHLPEHRTIVVNASRLLPLVLPSGGTYLLADTAGTGTRPSPFELAKDLHDVDTVVEYLSPAEVTPPPLGWVQTWRCELHHGTVIRVCRRDGSAQ